MNATASRIAEEASRLSPSERAELVEHILTGLNETDPELDRAWAAEADDRLEAFKRGELRARRLEEILADQRQANG